MRVSPELVELIKMGAVKAGTELTIENDVIVKINDQPFDMVYAFFSHGRVEEPEDNEPDDELSLSADLLDPEQVCEMLHISMSTLLRLRRTDDFPAAIAVSKRKRRWPRAEIVKWMARTT